MPRTVYTSAGAPEEGTFVVTAAFTDEDGSAVTPGAITWTLTKKTDASVVNSREDVSVSSPASSTAIVLQGDDLAVTAGDNRRRVLTFSYTYDSTYGSNLPGTAEFEFTIVSLANIP